MKKFTVAICVFVLAFALCGCFFGGNSGSGGATYTISIEYEEETQTFENLSASSVKISPKFKEGYVLTGFYSQKNGAGEQYLDYKGKSIKSHWQKSYPATLYPCYEKIDYSHECEVTFAQDTPTKYTYNIHNDPKKMTFDIADKGNKFSYFLQVAYSNPTVKIKFDASVDLRRNGKYDYTTTFTIAMGDDINTGYISSKQFKLPNDSYERHSLSTEITGRALANNEGKKFYAGLFWGGNNVDSYGLLQNGLFRFTFVKPEAAE